MRDTHHHFTGRYLAMAETQGWEYATRTNASAVAVLVPVTNEQELVLVEQPRIPVDARVIELPAGLAGDGAHRGEAVETAAHRELLEETGYNARHLQHLLTCPSTAGLSDEIIHIFLAWGLERVGAGGGDASEDITVHHVPLADADRWLADRQSEGLMLDPKVYCALHWLERPGAINCLAPEARDWPGMPPAT